MWPVHFAKLRYWGYREFNRSHENVFFWTKMHFRDFGEISVVTSTPNNTIFDAFMYNPQTFWYDINAFMYNPHAFLYNIDAFMYNSHAFSYNIDEFVYSSHAFWYDFYAFMYNSHVFWYNIDAFMYNPHAFGYNWWILFHFDTILMHSCTILSDADIISILFL